MVKPAEVTVAAKRDCSLVGRYNWDTKVAYAICMAESGGNPNAVGYNTNGTTDKGLMQINSVHVPHLISDAERLDPEANVKAAYSIYLGSGWSAWSTFNNGSYGRYM